MSNLVRHAEVELKRAGLLEPDSDYGGEAGRAILEVVRVFAKQQHSGGSAWVVRSALDKLLAFKPLTPITSDPEEWFDHGEGMGPDGERIWQNKRRGSTFSRDGGKTWYDIDDPTQNNGDTWKRAAAPPVGETEEGTT